MSPPKKKISLGLQGGGSYGAFTWGVLDRLLQEERLEIVSLSGASAGAINAAVVADGWAHGGGPEGARRALDRFWRALGGTARAFQVSPESGAFAALAMGLNGAMTALLAPWLVPQVVRWLAG